MLRARIIFIVIIISMSIVGCGNAEQDAQNAVLALDKKFENSKIGDLKGKRTGLIVNDLDPRLIEIGILKDELHDITVKYSHTDTISDLIATRKSETSLFSRNGYIPYFMKNLSPSHLKFEDFRRISNVSFFECSSEKNVEELESRVGNGYPRKTITI